ncbi:hypothetical protein L3X38_021853 [Prunus dulcis]|uniref:Uncharacterized protein n=1 Tax=Prunus dulcis TaxID=3755 RepID=A0AAD4VXL3_PRUDU|nr:hypothetical protein L3X38_021853 [Prunus dulcis]
MAAIDSNGNTPPRRDLVEPPPPMIESSLYSIVSGYKDWEYFNYMMSEQLIQQLPNRSLHYFQPPYGKTYFHHPTGRCSDGLLIIDFIAQFLGLPFVPPFLQSLNSNQSVQNFEAGVDFAVIGATGLDASFLATMEIHIPSTNNSLRIQLEWFKQMLPSLCNTSLGVNRARGSNNFGTRQNPIGCLPTYLSKPR